MERGFGLQALRTPASKSRGYGNTVMENEREGDRDPSPAEYDVLEDQRIELVAHGAELVARTLSFSCTVLETMVESMFDRHTHFRELAFAAYTRQNQRLIKAYKAAHADQADGNVDDNTSLGIRSVDGCVEEFVDEGVDEGVEEGVNEGVHGGGFGGLPRSAWSRSYLNEMTALLLGECDEEYDRNVRELESLACTAGERSVCEVLARPEYVDLAESLQGFDDGVDALHIHYDAVYGPSSASAPPPQPTSYSFRETARDGRDSAVRDSTHLRDSVRKPTANASAAALALGTSSNAANGAIAIGGSGIRSLRLSRHLPAWGGPLPSLSAAGKNDSFSCGPGESITLPRDSILSRGDSILSHATSLHASASGAASGAASVGGGAESGTGLRARSRKRLYKCLSVSRTSAAEMAFTPAIQRSMARQSFLPDLSKIKMTPTLASAASIFRRECDARATGESRGVSGRTQASRPLWTVPALNTPIVYPSRRSQLPEPPGKTGDHPHRSLPEPKEIPEPEPEAPESSNEPEANESYAEGYDSGFAGGYADVDAGARTEKGKGEGAGGGGGGGGVLPDDEGEGDSDGVGDADGEFDRADGCAGSEEEMGAEGGEIAEGGEGDANAPAIRLKDCEPPSFDASQVFVWPTDRPQPQGMSSEGVGEKVICSEGPETWGENGQRTKAEHFEETEENDDDFVVNLQCPRRSRNISDSGVPDSAPGSETEKETSLGIETGVKVGAREEGEEERGREGAERGREGEGEGDAKKPQLPGDPIGFGSPSKATSEADILTVSPEPFKSLDRPSLYVDAAEDVPHSHRMDVSPSQVPPEIPAEEEIDEGLGRTEGLSPGAVIGDEPMGEVGQESEPIHNAEVKQLAEEPISCAAIKEDIEAEMNGEAPEITPGDSSHGLNVVKPSALATARRTPPTPPPTASFLRAKISNQFQTLKNRFGFTVNAKPLTNPLQCRPPLPPETASAPVTPPRAQKGAAPRTPGRPNFSSALTPSACAGENVAPLNRGPATPAAGVSAAIGLTGKAGGNGAFPPGGTETVADTLTSPPETMGDFVDEVEAPAKSVTRPMRTPCPPFGAGKMRPGFHRLLRPLKEFPESFVQYVISNNEAAMADRDTYRAPLWAHHGRWVDLVQAQKDVNPYSIFGCGTRLVTFDAVFQTPDIRQTACPVSGGPYSKNTGKGTAGIVGGESRGQGQGKGQPQLQGSGVGVGSTSGAQSLARRAKGSRRRRWEEDTAATGFQLEGPGMSPHQLQAMLDLLKKTRDLSHRAYAKEWQRCDASCAHQPHQPWYKPAPASS